jgi:hypothetical protein
MFEWGIAVKQEEKRGRQRNIHAVGVSTTAAASVLVNPAEEQNAVRNDVAVSTSSVLVHNRFARDETMDPADCSVSGRQIHALVLQPSWASTLMVSPSVMKQFCTQDFRLDHPGPFSNTMTCAAV